MLITSQASSQTFCNHSTFPALSSSCSHSFTHFRLISLCGGLSLSPSCSGDCPSLLCKGTLSSGLPFCTSVIEYLQCESGYFPSHFYHFLFFRSQFLFFSWYVFLFFNLKPVLFFLIKPIHILLPSLLPLPIFFTAQRSHCCMLAIEVVKVHALRLAQAALWYCFWAGVQSSRFWNVWCNGCSLFLNSSQTRVMVI